jgi:phage recombination protein Bet
LPNRLAVTEKGEGKMTTLAVTTTQNTWDAKQIAALKQVGLENVPQAELAVFLHYCQRTGLDPFARQIYMINRGGKYTIQASIDGLRIVAQRSGNYGGQTPAEWCGDDGVWRDVWLDAMPPKAARIGVYYKDSANPTWAIAKFDSYAVAYNGKLSGLWAKMPDLMIAKCAEALALRKAFPNDLSGVYTTEEMQQVDNTAHNDASPVVEPVKVIASANSAQADRIMVVNETIDAIENMQDLIHLRNASKDLLDLAVDGVTLNNLFEAKRLELTK